MGLTARCTSKRSRDIRSQWSTIPREMVRYRKLKCGKGREVRRNFIEDFGTDGIGVVLMQQPYIFEGRVTGGWFLEGGGR